MKTEVASLKGTGIAPITGGAKLPAYMKQDGGRGSEQVKAEDLVIPRLEIVQALSPARDKKHPNYIEGAEEGMLYNTVTRELYGDRVLVVPVMFKKEYIVWKLRKAGGGFLGVAPTAEQGDDIKRAVPADIAKQDEIEVLDTAQQFCYLVKGDGSVEEIVVSMSKSKMKVSRKWNSLIRMGNGDSFSRAYLLETVQDKNKKGDTFYNLSVSVAGFPPEAIYKRAEALYEKVKSGAVSADRSTDGTAGPDEDPDL